MRSSWRSWISSSCSTIRYRFFHLGSSQIYYSLGCSSILFLSFWPVYYFSFCCFSFFVWTTSLFSYSLSIKLIIYYFILNIFSIILFYLISDSKKNWKKNICKRRREKRHKALRHNTQTPPPSTAEQTFTTCIYVQAFLRFNLRNQLWFKLFEEFEILLFAPWDNIDVGDGCWWRNIWVTSTFQHVTNITS